MPVERRDPRSHFIRARMNRIASMLRAMFPAPPAPTFPSNQAATYEGHLRYEDVTQDGRLMPIAVPPALAGFWRGVLVRHPGPRSSAKQGIIPILTRLTILAHEQHIRVDKPTQTHAGFQLARDPASERLFMNIWCEVRG